MAFSIKKECKYRDIFFKCKCFLKNNQTFRLLPFICGVKNFSCAIIGLLHINTKIVYCFLPKGILVVFK
jgi:hypothetical protein